MNSRERLTRCYFNQEIDRPGIYSRTGFPTNDSGYDKLKNYLKLHTDIKMCWDAQRLVTPYPTEQKVGHYSREYERVITILHTPLGDLTSTKLISLQNKPQMHETFFIKSIHDAEKYLSLPIPKMEGDVFEFFQMDKGIGERGITDILLGMNPAGTVVELMGSETFAITSITDRKVIYALCEREMKVKKCLLKYLAEKKVGPFFSMLGEEYIVPPLHGPKDFYDFNVKYDKPIIDLIHEMGGRIHIHSHGAVKKVLHGFIDMGVDVLHPIEPPPMGDITAKEAKQIVRGKLCIEGNIQISHMYEHTPKDLHEETEQLIINCFDDGKGLIVCPTASSYIYGEGERCFEQYKAMVDTVLRWRNVQKL